MADVDGRPPASADGAALDPAHVGELDRGDMLGAIAALPRQLTAGHAAAVAALSAMPAPSRPCSVIICGMGGSAIGGDLVLAALPELPVPALVVRGYRLPAWTGEGTLVIAVSYSGETEETLACAEQARAAEPPWSASPRAAGWRGVRGDTRPGAAPRARWRAAPGRRRLSGHAAARHAGARRPVPRRGRRRRGGGGSAARRQRRLRGPICLPPPTRRSISPASCSTG